MSNDKILLSLLKQEQPAIYADLDRRINNIRAEQKRYNVQTLPLVFEKFCRVRNIDANKINWKNPRGQKVIAIGLKGSVVWNLGELRKTFVCLAVRSYQPERLLMCGDLPGRTGLRIEIAKVLNCQVMPITNDMSLAVLYYKTYPEFKAEVNWLYSQIF